MSQQEQQVPDALRFWNYGDGGAFPEFHYKQFPSGFGKTIVVVADDSSQNNESSDNNNNNNDGAVSNNNNNNNSLMIIQTANSTLKASSFSSDQLAKPDEQSIASLEEQTRRQLELAKQRTSNVSTGIIGSITSTKQTKKTTEVIQTDDGRTIAITEVTRDVADPRKMKLQKLTNVAENTNNALVLAENQLSTATAAAPLIRSPTKKLTGDDAKAFAVPSAVYAHRNPKSKLISAEERSKHDGASHIDHKISDKHALAARAVLEATRRADRVEEQRKKDEEAEQERKKEEERKKLEEQAKASLRSQLAAASGSNQNNSASSQMTDYEQRSREMDEKRKIRQLQKTAERLGVNVEELIAQDDDDIEVLQTDTKSNNNNNSNSRIGQADSRLNHFMTAGRNALSDGSTLGYDTGLFQAGGNNSSSNSATMSSVMSTVNRERLQQEQMVQETIRAQREQQQKQQQEQQQQQEKIVTHDEDEDDDVFGVDDMM